MAVVLWKPQTDLSELVTVSNNDSMDQTQAQQTTPASAKHEQAIFTPVLETIIDNPFESESCDVEMEEEDL